MDSKIAALTEKMRALETELEAELAKKAAKLRFGLEKGKALFGEEQGNRVNLRVTSARWSESMAVI
jgi:hypothetical protein